MISENTSQIMRRCLTVIIISFALLSIPAYADSYAVIINASNNFSADKATASNIVKRLYLKQQSHWPDGSKAKPLGRSEDSPLQKGFIQSVLGMSDAELASHWISLKQKTGETPPRSVRSSKIAVKLVEKNSGGLAIIKKEDVSRISSKAKVLFTY